MDDLRQRIREEAHRIRPRRGLDDLMRQVHRRSQHRRISAMAVGLGGFAAIVFLGVIVALTPGNGGTRPQSGAPPEQSSTSQGVAVPGTCDHGPWISLCPEADWARSTLAAAGLSITDELPASFVVQHGDGELYFWATDPAIHSGVGPLESELATGDPFQVVQEVHGVPVYHLRAWWAWTVHGLNVWVSVANGGDPAPQTLEELVRASIEVPYLG